jgi:hypothetical protein
MPPSAHAQDDPQSRPAHQDLRHLWPPIHMAQEMGKSLGRGALLLRPLPQRAPARTQVMAQPFVTFNTDSALNSASTASVPCTSPKRSNANRIRATSR